MSSAIILRLVLCIACANLINLLNLEMIVIGGGVIAAGDLLLGKAAGEAQRRAFAPAAQVCRIVQSRLWPDAGLIGAAMLALMRRPLARTVQEPA